MWKSALSITLGALLSIAYRSSVDVTPDPPKKTPRNSNPRLSRVAREPLMPSSKALAADYRESFLKSAPDVLKNVFSKNGYDEILERCPGSEQLLADVIFKSVYDAALEDPKTMVDFLENGVCLYYQDIAAQAIGEALEKGDRGQVSGMVDAIGNKELQQVIRRKLLAVLATTRPAEALSEYKKLNDSSQLDQLRSIFASLSGISISVAEAEVKSLPNTPERIAALDGMFLALAKRGSPELILETIDNFAGDERSRALNAAVLGAAIANRPDAMRRFLAEATDGQRVPFLSSAIAALPRGSLIEADKMAKDLLADGDYHKVLPHLVPKIASFTDFTTLGHEIVILPDSGFRDRLLTVLANSVQKGWKVQAAAWVQEQDVAGSLDRQAFGSALAPGKNKDALEWDQ